MPRLRGLAALLALLTVTVAAPLLVLALLGGPSIPTAAHEWVQLDPRYDPTRLTITGLGWLFWLCWALWVIALVAALVEHQGSTGRSTARHRLLPLQSSARTLLATVALLVGPAGTALAAGPTPAPPAVQSVRVPHAHPTGLPRLAVDAGRPAAEPSPEDAASAALPVITVQPRDDLWDLAARHLGDPLRWAEIAKLNYGRAQPDGGALTNPNLIRVGWRLLLPADAVHVPAPVSPPPPRPAAPPAVPTTMPAVPTAKPAAPTTMPAPAAIPRTEPSAQSGGAPGEWTPEMSPTRPATADDRPVPTPPPATGNPEQPTVATPPASTATPATAPGPAAADPATSAHPTAAEDDRAVTEWVAGGGVLFASLFVATLAVLRRRQRGLRRPGRQIALPPPELLATETALVRVSDQDLVVWLDLSLRALAEAWQQHLPRDGTLTSIPNLLAARLNPTRLECVFADPPPAPPPWQSRTDVPNHLTLLRADAPVRADAAHSPAPFPALTSIGRDGDDILLVDLEAVGSLTITGDPARARDLLRSMAAELSLNTWSDELRITLVDLAEDLVPLRPDRLRHLTLPTAVRAIDHQLAAAAEADAALTTSGDPLEGRLRDEVPDAWMSDIYLVGSDDPTPLTELLCEREGRSTVCVAVAVPDDTDPSPGWQLHVTADGDLLLPALAWTGHAMRLPADLADDLTALTDIAHDMHGHPAPPPEESAPAADPVDQDCPDPDPTIDAAVPVASAEVIDPFGHRLDPDLDDRVKAWDDPSCPHPKIRLLGDVHVDAHGQQPRSLPQPREVIAYLVLHPRGAELPTIQADIWPDGDPDPSTCRRALTHVRKWLGDNPSTGQPYLPLAYDRRYRLSDDVLVDWTLFTSQTRRAAARSPRRADLAIDDLLAALTLVQDRPFANVFRRYEWRTKISQPYEMDRHIVDAAHQLAELCLQQATPDRLDDAHDAVQRALIANEHCSIDLFIDLMKIAVAQGQRWEFDHHIHALLTANDLESVEDLPADALAEIARLQAALRAPARQSGG